MKQSITPSNMLALLFSPASEINSLIQSFTLPNSHHWLFLLKPGNSFSNSLAEVSLATGILLFTLLGSLLSFDGVSRVENAGWQTRKSILILRGTECLQVPQETISGKVPCTDAGRTGLCWKVPAKPGSAPFQDSEAPWKALELLGVVS